VNHRTLTGPHAGRQGTQPVLTLCSHGRVIIVSQTKTRRPLAQEPRDTGYNVNSRTFLIICAVGLVPIALSYGVKPAASLGSLFDITVDTTNLTHIMRAVMGLYLGMVALWLLGAFKPSLTGPALVSCAVFMLGLAAGRILSLVIDGTPHWLLVVYTGLELIFGSTAVWLYREQSRAAAES
jgi:hypothetical protein